MLQAVKLLPFSYWLLFYITAASSSMIHVMMLFSVDYLHEKWGYSEVVSGQLTSGVYVTGIVISLISGFIIQKRGHIISLLFIGLLVFGGGCVVLAATSSFNPIVGFIAIGFGLGSLETTVWTAVAAVISEQCIGPAFAFLSAIGAIMMLVVPYGSGWMHDQYGSYDTVAYLCGAGAFSGLIAVIALYFFAPELQKPIGTVYKQYYILKIVAQRKHQQLGPRRHSITGINDARRIANHYFNDDIDHQQIFKNKRPLLLDLLSDKEREALLTGADRHHSLPPNFFSPIVRHTVEFAKHEDNTELPDSAVGLENPPEDPDLKYIWQTGTPGGQESGNIQDP